MNWLEFFVTPLVGVSIGIVFIVFLSYVYWLAGFLLYQFKFSKFVGFKLMCMSGWFPKLLPKYCPCSSCSDTPCGMWTCPQYKSDNKKDSGLP